MRYRRTVDFKPRLTRDHQDVRPGTINVRSHRRTQHGSVRMRRHFGCLNLELLIFFGRGAIPHPNAFPSIAALPREKQHVVKFSGEARPGTPGAVPKVFRKMSILRLPFVLATQRTLTSTSMVVLSGTKGSKCCRSVGCRDSFSTYRIRWIHYSSESWSWIDVGT